MKKQLLLILPLALAGVIVYPRFVHAQEAPKAQNNAELQKICDEDQADRSGPVGKIDWKVVEPRDAARLRRVKEIVHEGTLTTGMDYFNAALVLQHGDKPEDYLLSHELCVVSIGLGGAKSAKWLAAASEDRFLMNLKRPQRFGTQYRSDPPDNKIRLYTVDPDVTDAMRKAMGCPTLAQAKLQELEWQKQGGGVRR